MTFTSYRELQNDRVRLYEGCFRLHQVANAKESRLYESVTSLKSHTLKAA